MAHEHIWTLIPLISTPIVIDLKVDQQGIATAELVPLFTKVIGVDESEPMIEVARTNVPKAEFHISSVDDLSVIQSETVDLVTVATAGV